MTRSHFSLGISCALLAAVLVVSIHGEGIKSGEGVAKETPRGGQYPHDDGWGASQQYHYSSYPSHHGHHGIDITTAILIFIVLGALMCYPIYMGYGHGHKRAFSANGDSFKDLAGITDKVVTAVEKLYKTYSNTKA